MIEFEKFTLGNGLTVLVHTDNSTPIAAVNVLYNVGSRDESPDRTGFAHLFEHLMFGGSVNIPKYDEPLEKAGGENNAFTNSDITNYYLTLPVRNLETAFWLESDRMLDLAFTPKSLEVQRSVVVEEFRQNYLNQPYGDAWLLLKPLAYKVHPYQWPTIGKDPSHIENAGMDEVREFYKTFYNPCNAILVVAGNVTVTQVKQLAEKWFGPISKGKPILRNLPSEPPQAEARSVVAERNVPYDAIYKTWHMPGRMAAEFHAIDLVSDLFSAGKSGRLYLELVKKQQLFSDLNAYVSGDIDDGLFVITGKLMKGISFEQAEDAISAELDKITGAEVPEAELRKVKNRVESYMVFSEMKVLDKAMNLAYYELLGNAGLINEVYAQYDAVTSLQIREQAARIFSPANCSTLYYKAVQ